MLNNQPRSSVVSIGFSSDESRRKRETETLSLRKKAREERFSKRRQNVTQELHDSPMDFTEKIQINNALLHSNDENEVIAAAVEIRKMLSLAKSPPIDQIIQAGVVDRLVSCLYSPNELLQYESLWCLTNIASGSHEHTEYLVNLDIIHLFFERFKSENPKVREQAVWVIGNISGDCNEFRDYVLEHGGMSYLLELLEVEQKPLVIKVAVWTMSNLCRGKPQPPFSLVSPAIPYAGSLVHSDDKDVVVDALWTLSFLSDGKDKKQAAVAKLDILPTLINFLNCDDHTLLVPSLRIVGNLLSGDNETTQKVIDAGALIPLKNLLLSEKDAIRKETCWSLSNVLAGTVDQIESVIKLEIVPMILHILQHDKFDIRKEAAFCIANAVSGADMRQILYFTYNNCLPILCSLLNNKDIQLVYMTLDAIEKCLKVGEKLLSQGKIASNIFVDTVADCGGLDNIEKLMIRNQNDKVYNKCVKIRDRYFKSSEENQNMIEPEHAQEYNFNVQNTPSNFNI